YADLLLAARLTPRFAPRPDPGQVALFAVWQDEVALDRFLDADPLAARLAPGRALRLEPLRASGAWTGLPPLVGAGRALAGDEPVAVLTYGRLKLHRGVAFLRASARAEADAIEHPGLVDAVGLARLPRLVSTFSLWSTTAAMDDFARRRSGHTAALRAVAERDFHRESIFLRFRPYAPTGDWGAPDPRR
ncbi:MAG TPA: hypothetical protein VFR49_04905, partial [Solirubrobacteraceae bacterium]|nr:hypothetical protein [Solirubrobacteraceae bacterium]